MELPEIEVGRPHTPQALFEQELRSRSYPLQSWQSRL
jgi:hypothetical protein